LAKLQAKRWISVLLARLFCSLRGHGNFCYEIFSQGSMATYARCGGIFNNHFIANFVENLPMKEFLKSIKVWQSYCHEFLMSPFLGHSIDIRRIGPIARGMILSFDIQFLYTPTSRFPFFLDHAFVFSESVLYIISASAYVYNVTQTNRCRRNGIWFIGFVYAVVWLGKKAELRQACIVQWCLVPTRLTWRHHRRPLADSQAPVVSPVTARSRHLDVITVTTGNDVQSSHTAFNCLPLHHCEHLAICLCGHARLARGRYFHPCSQGDSSDVASGYEYCSNLLFLLL